MYSSDAESIDSSRFFDVFLDIDVNIDVWRNIGL